MAFKVIYKNLFEIMLLHDFYLKDPAAFHEPGTGEELTLQRNILSQNNYHIGRVLLVEPTQECLHLLRGRRMVFRPTATGFVVAMEVVLETDGSDDHYLPFIPLEEGLRLSFRLRIKDPHFAHYTNLRVQPGVAGNYYFSNAPQGGGLVYPYLSLEPGAYAGGRYYEMGEQVSSGGDIYQAQVNIDDITSPGSAGWLQREVLPRYVSYRDRQLVGSRIDYQFTLAAGDLAEDAEFRLTDESATEVFHLDEGGTGIPPFRFFSLDLSEIEIETGVEGIPPGYYELETSTSAGYSETKDLLIDPARYIPGDLGLLEIVHEPGLNDFRLLEPQGWLREEDGTTQHPVFQICFQRRSTYWQFYLQEEDIAQVSDSNYDVFVSEGYIVTKSPQELSVSGKKLNLSNGSEVRQLPGVTNLSIKPRPDKFYSEVYVPRMGF